MLYNRQNCQSDISGEKNVPNYLVLLKMVDLIQKNYFDGSEVKGMILDRVYSAHSLLTS